MPTDTLGWLLIGAFGALISLPAALLALTYVSFARMAKDVRRARMFIMADRIKRFLGAFTVGFVVLAVTFAALIILPSLQVAFSVAFFFFLGTIAYGIVELYFIVRPRRTLHAPNGKSWRPSLSRNSMTVKPRVGSAEDDGDGAH